MSIEWKHVCTCPLQMKELEHLSIFLHTNTVCVCVCVNIRLFILIGCHLIFSHAHTFSCSFFLSSVVHLHRQSKQYKLYIDLIVVSILMPKYARTHTHTPNRFKCILMSFPSVDIFRISLHSFYVSAKSDFFCFATESTFLDRKKKDFLMEFSFFASFFVSLKDHFRDIIFRLFCSLNIPKQGTSV